MKLSGLKEYISRHQVYPYEGYKILKSADKILDSLRSFNHLPMTAINTKKKTIRSIMCITELPVLSLLYSCPQNGQNDLLGLPVLRLKKILGIIERLQFGQVTRPDPSLSL